MEQIDLQPDEAVRLAAEFIVRGRNQVGQALVPEIRTRFGVTTLQAVDAIRLAQKLRSGGADVAA
ncbi:hypothetical protein [Mesorhizobium kowhaii]|uniref:Uncharacterized protein n=1 Tax=Mesorhizobium kowhaii TaxID=1300272 RepID=A0A2W7C986_9HYPH|nr:hypothetical protein [Mesorhizobium kowhaii]PZV39742.1 hypothetical protein B5V02_07380 [Mesorhizobium kowhaii]